MKLDMSISEMIEFHKILEKKLSRTRSTAQLDFIEKQMDVVYGVLSAALFNTVSETMPQIKIALEASSIDRSLLQSIIGIERVKKLPTQGEFEFNVIEDVEATAIQPDLKTELSGLVSKSFAKNIPIAVEKYKEITGSKKPNSTCWLEIKKLFPDNYPFKMWDKYLANTLIDSGPVKAFFSIKKHMPNWDDMDIAILLSNAVENHKSELPESETSKKERVDLIIKSGLSNLRDYLNDESTINLFNVHESITAKENIGARLNKILRVCQPDERAKFLKRKEYVEKGY